MFYFGGEIHHNFYLTYKNSHKSKLTRKQVKMRNIINHG